MTQRSNTQDQPIRRRDDGSIDTDYYMNVGRVLRSEALRDAGAEICARARWVKPARLATV